MVFCWLGGILWSLLLDLILLVKHFVAGFLLLGLALCLLCFFGGWAAFVGPFLC